MENIKISATDRTPEIDFNFAENRFSISGESYPEDVNAFFGDILTGLQQHLDGLSGASVELNLEFIYFNSSTAKVVLQLFDMMDAAAEKGNRVMVNWRYDADDDYMEEMGEEFGEDLEAAEFHLQPK